MQPRLRIPAVAGLLLLTHTNAIRARLLSAEGADTPTTVSISAGGATARMHEDGEGRNVTGSSTAPAELLQGGRGQAREANGDLGRTSTAMGAALLWHVWEPFVVSRLVVFHG